MIFVKKEQAVLSYGFRYFCAQVSVSFSFFLRRVDRLGSGWDATVTGGTSIAREEGKKNKTSGPRGQSGSKPGV